MANEAVILGKLRGAQIPTHAYSTSLKRENHTALSAVIANKGYSLGAEGYRSFRVFAKVESKRTSAVVAKACALFAKELVLAGAKVKYVAATQMFLWSRQMMLPQGLEDEKWFEIGKGFLVVSDLGESINNWTANEWDIVQQTILIHLSKGGGIVIGDTGALNSGLYNADMVNELAMFTCIEVG